MGGDDKQMNLTKISQKIWQIAGLVAGALFLLGILAIVVGVGFAVFQYKTHHVNGIAVDPMEDKGNLKVTAEYGLPLPLEGSDFYMIPVTLEKKKHGQAREVFSEVASRSSYDSYSSGSYSSYSWGPYYNLVFINKKTGESRPLLTQKGFINGVYLPEKKYDKKDTEIKPTFLLLKIATADTNNDGVINEKDASAGFIASIDGTKLTQVTPDNTQMKWWSYDLASQRLFVEIIHDVNNDKEFDWDDPQTVLSVNVLDPKIAQEFVSTEIKNKIEALLLKK